MNIKLQSIHFRRKLWKVQNFSVSCPQLLYRSSVCNLNRERFLKKIDNYVFSSCIVYVISPDEKEYIYNMWKWNGPNISVGHGFELDDVPTELIYLDKLDAVFIPRLNWSVTKTGNGKRNWLKNGMKRKICNAVYVYLCKTYIQYICINHPSFPLTM